MASTTSNSTSKPFHAYDNVAYDDQTTNSCNFVPPTQPILNNNSIPLASATVAPTLSSVGGGGGAATAIATTATTNTAVTASSTTMASTTIAATQTTCAIESPFSSDPVHETTQPTIPNATTTQILSATDSSGTTRMLTSKTVVPGQNLVTKLIMLPAQSPMDSLKEWSVSTFKCTKQFINEKRGACSITNDAQLQIDIDQLRETRDRLQQMLRAGQQMVYHYTALVKSQRQLHTLMNEMSMKCVTTSNSPLAGSNNQNQNNNHKKRLSSSKQIVTKFSSLSNNLSSTTTTSPTHHRSNTCDRFEDFMPVLAHMKSSNANLVDDFGKNAITLNMAIRNGEKLIAALNVYCSNLSTLINKTIEDTLLTVKQYESARLEYDAERNSLNFGSPSANASMTYSSDKLELSRIRFEQLRDDVQIKMKFLEENIVKVTHKQLTLFNGAFGSYTSGNAAALDETLKQFSIR